MCSLKIIQDAAISHPPRSRALPIAGARLSIRDNAMRAEHQTNRTLSLTRMPFLSRILNLQYTSGAYALASIATRSRACQKLIPTETRQSIFIRCAIITVNTNIICSRKRIGQPKHSETMMIPTWILAADVWLLKRSLFLQVLISNITHSSSA